MARKNIEIQDNEGNIYYPHTDSSIVSYGDKTVQQKIDELSKIQTAGGTATAITLSNVSLVNGMIITFVVAGNNNGAATTINGKALYKPNTTQPPTLVAGKAVTVWYNGTHFFIKASAEGNAVAGDVLAGKTFSNDNDTGLVGTIPTATTTSPYEASSELYVANGEAWLRTQGNKYWPDKTWIKFNEPNLTPANIKAGVTIGSTTKITGSFTNDADAVAGNILASKTAYVKGNKVTGNIPSKAAATITPSTANQTIASGQYLSGVQTIKGDANLIPANILSGKSIFGVAGSISVGKRNATGYLAELPSGGDTFEVYEGSSSGYSRSCKRLQIRGLAFTPTTIIITLKPQFGSIVKYAITVPMVGYISMQRFYTITNSSGLWLDGSIFINKNGPAGSICTTYTNGFDVVAFYGSVNITWEAFE